MVRSGDARVVSILWFVAAALSLTAALVTWIRHAEFRWALVGAAIFTAIMGVASLRSGSTRA